MKWVLKTLLLKTFLHLKFRYNLLFYLLKRNRRLLWEWFRGYILRRLLQYYPIPKRVYHQYIDKDKVLLYFQTYRQRKTVVLRGRGKKFLRKRMILSYSLLCRLLFWFSYNYFKGQKQVNNTIKHLLTNFIVFFKKS